MYAKFAADIEKQLLMWCEFQIYNSKCYVAHLNHMTFS